MKTMSLVGSEDWIAAKAGLLLPDVSTVVTCICGEQGGEAKET